MKTFWTTGIDSTSAPIGNTTLPVIQAGDTLDEYEQSDVEESDPVEEGTDYLEEEETEEELSLVEDAAGSEEESLEEASIKAQKAALEEMVRQVDASKEEVRQLQAEALQTLEVARKQARVENVVAELLRFGCILPHEEQVFSQLFFVLDGIDIDVTGESEEELSLSDFLKTRLLKDPQIQYGEVAEPERKVDFKSSDDLTKAVNEFMKQHDIKSPSIALERMRAEGLI